MKFLVIGGSYFLGRVFVMLASPGHEVTVLNRGTYSMKESGVREWRANRRDFDALRKLPEENFDAVIDCCAYAQGDIAGFLDAYRGKIGQYLFVSTADVYEKWTGKVLTEESPLETRHFGGENGEYIWQKLLLEKELKEVCAQKKIEATSVRPAILYGPFNYAMRESVYVQMAQSGREILCPVGAKGRFQPVYVKDAAAMMLALAGNEKAFGQAYNLAGEPVDYEAFLTAFSVASKGKAKLLKVGSEAECLRLPEAFLPFPLTEEETEYYESRKILTDTGLSFIPLEEGLQKTYQIFSKIYPAV